MASKKYILDKKAYLSPEVVAKIAGLELKAKLVVEGFISGLHKSPHHGFNVEFSEYRQYYPGDELRYIDWRVYGKTDKYFIKQFEEETNLKATIILDASKSMAFTSNQITKFEYSTYLVAALSYLILKQRDAVGLAIFQQGISKYLPPKNNSAYIKQIIYTLNSTEPKGQTDIAITFHQLAEKIKKRGLIIVLSDFFDEYTKVLEGLQHFRHRHHEVIVFHILDDAEINFPFDDEVKFIDIENKTQILTNASSIKEKYVLLLANFLKEFKLVCGQSKIDYFPITTKTGFDVALRNYLIKRNSYGKRK